MSNKLLYVQYTTAKAGKAGLSDVVVYVYRIARSNGAKSLIVNGAAATEGAYGVYYHLLSNVDMNTYDYVAVFVTADSTVDAKEIAALLTDQTALAIDADGKVSVSDTLLTATDVWSAATRTLTQTAAQLAAVLTGSAIVIQRGDSFSLSLTGLGSLANLSKLWFTAKQDRSDADASAIIQIEKTAGLVYLNAAGASTPAHGTITVNDATSGNITVMLDKAETASLAEITGDYDVQMLRNDGTVLTLTEGAFLVTSDITRAVS